MNAFDLPSGRDARDVCDGSPEARLQTVNVGKMSPPILCCLSNSHNCPNGAVRVADAGMRRVPVVVTVGTAGGPVGVAFGRCVP